MAEMADQIYGNVDHIQRFDEDEDDVYANQDTTANETRDETKNKEEDSGGDSREVKCYRVAVVSLGLLCVLLLAITISVVIKGTAQRKQLQNEIQLQQFINNNLTKEQDQLQAEITILTQEKDQLQSKTTILTQEKDQLQSKTTTLTREKDQLQSKTTILTREKDQLQSKTTILTREKDQLQATINILNQRLEKCLLPALRSSRYYISSDQKSWTESKQHCMDLGGHLVIIDSKEEQEFIYTQIKSSRAWIGLSDLETEGVWKWVDGKRLYTSGFWRQGEPNGNGVEIIGINQDNPLKTWNDNVCRKAYQYICEINLT